MKVLFTGMASSHCKPSTNTTFFKLLASRVADTADIEWATPSVLWTKDFLDQYDAIFVGMLPPTSPSANKLYGAMHVIDLMFESPKLTLVLEHPQMWQYKHGFNAIDRDVSAVFSSFYSKRREFSLARDSYSDSVSSANLKLLTKPWPKTIYPSLPWDSKRNVSKLLSLTAEESLIPVNLDIWLMEDSDKNFNDFRNEHWVADAPASEWTKEVSRFLEHPVLPLKEKRQISDKDALDVIQSSSGFLFSPQERGVGTWWSYRLIQALNSYVSVLSDWKETGSLGEEWNLLAFELESLPISDKIHVAKAQRESYIRAIPDKQQTKNLITSILENSLKGESNARS